MSLGEVPSGLHQRVYYRLGLKWNGGVNEKSLLFPIEANILSTITSEYIKTLTQQPTETNTLTTISLEISKVLTQQPTETFNLSSVGVEYVKNITQPTEVSLVELSYWNNVSALLHFNGTNGSTVFTDEKGHLFSRIGTGSSIATAQSVFGGASLGNNGLAGSMVTSPNSTDWQFGTGDFTVEFRVRFSAFPGTSDFYIMSYTSANVFSGNDVGWFVYRGSGNYYFGIYQGTTLALVYIAGALVTNTWYSFAVSRISGLIYTFLDGVLVVSSGFPYNINVPAATPTLRIGGYPTLNTLNGYMDELRITKGVGRYSSNYTLATEQFYTQ